MDYERLGRARGDALAMERKYRTIPLRYVTFTAPLNAVVATYKAPQTMTLKGYSISASIMPVTFEGASTFLSITTSAAPALGYSGNEESTWADHFVHAGCDLNIYNMFPNEYDGFYLNIGESVYVYLTTWYAYNNALPVTYMNIGTVTLFFTPTGRQG
jgi:hypothetical protein